LIYLHCGWPKTGTTSLQAALLKHRDLLASEGFAYPDAWRLGNDGAHHGLVDVLSAASESGAALSEFQEALMAEEAQHVLLSAESITIWLMKDEKCEVLLRFLHAVREVGPLSCLWTLRRFDDLVHSGCMHALLVGEPTRSPIDLMRSFQRNRIFANMPRVEDAVDGNAVYVRYEPSGAHNAELLRTLGLSDDLAGAILSEMAASPRANASRSRKQLAAVIGADTLSSRTVVGLDKPSLRKAFASGNFSFENDGPCELAGRETRLELHENALRLAREHGFEAYQRFFADEQLGEFPDPARIDADAITDRDLDSLVEYIESSDAGERSGRALI